MVNEQFIQPPGSVFEARSALARLGCSDASPEDLMALAARRIGSPDLNDKAVGFRMLWAAACLGDRVAGRRLAAAIEKHVEETELPEAEAVFFSKVADHWREVLEEEFDFTGMAASPHSPAGPAEERADRDAHVEVQDFAQPPSVQAKRSSSVVLAKIGDAGSREGRELAAKFAPMIGRPIPARGFVPGEGAIRAAIAATCPWASQAAEVLETAFAIMRMTGSSKSTPRPMLFVGPEGTGKTSLALSIGRMTGRHTVRLPGAGTHDSGSLAPMARGWSGSRPCLPAQTMLESMSCDPCILIDELDKASRGTGPNGSLTGTLHGMLDHAEQYYDSMLLSNVDLSNVMFMATANSITGLGDSLLDRFTIVPVPRPGAEHFDHVLAHMRAKAAAELDVDPFVIPDFDELERRALKDFFVRNRGSLRAMARAFDSVLAAALEREHSAALM
jgi:hypothetical protein